MLAHSVQIEELSVTEVEVRDERFLRQIPRHRASCRHERRHTVPCVVVGVVCLHVVHSRTVGGIACTAGEVAFGAQHVGILLHCGVGTEFAAAFPEHIICMCAPETYRDGIVLEECPRAVLGLAALHVYTCIEVERAALQALRLCNRFREE